MARNIFISILGAGYYSETNYYFKSKEQVIKTYFIQDASLELVAKEWTNSDTAYIFLTEKAKKTNWYSPAQKNNLQNKPSYKGLQEIIESKNTHIKIEAIDILDGNNEEEIWQIFESVYGVMQEGDHVYFDITHAFRSIPMLVMVLINYAKFLKSIEVQSITYGNWENRDPENYSPIIELKSFSDLQDWTSAANEFINTGRLKKIIEKLKQKSKTDLYDFSNEILTCRGLEIQNSANILNFKKALNNVKDEKPPFIAIKEKIIDKVKYYRQEDVLNGFRAVRYCIDFDLIQQGITLLIESIISKVMVDIGIKEKPKLKSYHIRNVVTVCLQKNSIDEINIFDFLNTREKEYETTKQKKIKEYSSYSDSIFRLYYKNDLTNKVFCELSQSVRNDINHAGYRPEPMESNVFKSKLEDSYKVCCELLSCKS